ncbi:ABC transporter permease [Nocardioides sp. LMS-CY]|uniref:sugar ABC transporter permease n=1 Tax=Nocardioides sp. (strain LMS-CY) TaxID=2840457 RepID=UPI001C00316D|nr:ABC transporter permease [Nocardioides sp. LMS-CY]QWF20341.1 ABC transporter permease [Nocardioides sp. LMS-CY]
MTAQQTETPEVAPEPWQASGIGGIARAYVAKVRGGDVGALPAVLGLVVLVVVFSVLRPETFTSELNFANLINQSAAITVIAMGLVFVLLLGEIDLSAGVTGGTAAAVMGVVMTNHEQNWLISILACIATGAVIGAAIGLLVARLGIPSFVVTLAAFLGLQGVMLEIIGEGGTIPFKNEKILALTDDNLPVWLGWTIALALVVGFAGLTFLRNSRRRRAGLQYEPMLLWAIKSGALLVITVLVTYYLSKERSINPTLKSLKGVPVSLVVILGLLLVLSFLLSRTAWGRHVYAVGGNGEAARRAGINVKGIKLSCFVLSSSVAAIGGLMLAARSHSVSPSTGGNETLLYAVGAAVIGGTSLFGGKGRVVDAVIGGTVIAVISNGMGLLNKSAGVVYIVTGLVLLVAASVDAISRRRAAASGRA